MSSLRIYLFFLVKAFLVTVWYAEASGVENVCNLQAAQNAFNLSPTGTLPVKSREQQSFNPHAFMLTDTCMPKYRYEQKISLGQR